MESADQILAQRVVDPRLAADARIHLRDDGRRHLHVGYAAQVGRRDEARHIADDTAAQRGDPGAAIEFRLDHFSQNPLGAREILHALATGVNHLQHLEASRAQAVGRRLEVARGYRLVADQRHLPPQALLATAGSQLAENVVADKNGIGRSFDSEVNSVHASAPTVG